MDLGQNIASILEQMAKYFQSETVVGDPIQVGNVTLIPLISISFGVGNSSGYPPLAKRSTGGGAGAGAGGKILPIAIIVIKDDETSVISLSGKGVLDKITDIMPLIQSKFDNNRPNDEQGNT